MTSLPLIIEPDELEQHLADDKLLLVDLSKHSQYLQAHIPGAVFLDYAYVTAISKPTMGLLPDAERFGHILSTLGMTEDTHVVAYDEEGGGKAARLIWTLHAMGHFKTSLLNGGIISWFKEEHPLVADVTHSAQTNYAVSYTHMDVVADTDYILQNLQNSDVALLDARSEGEYDGSKKFAERAGRIPGAIRFEWTDGMDEARHYRLLPDAELKSKLDALGLTADREIIVYCQTHHRSALSYVMLKHLGYERVRGYPGSWSEWGNRADTPVEI
ncbi:MAG: sulfurtransferase [Gammaproteobacteria bacterium]|nr:sulfurtransferase [Gammaproteobacteria bacterium]